MKRFSFALVLFAFSLPGMLAQKQNNIWYFGTNAGIDFNSGTAVSISGGKLNASEGGSSICDPNGKLLFYTDGITIWDRTHGVMPNGTGLAGGPSSTQSGLIIPKPGSCNLYYVFTVGDAQAGIGDLRYSIVDMCLNSGKGDVIAASKNTLLALNCSEKMTAILHSNGVDIWIVGHDLNSTRFRAYLLSSAGLNATPVLTNIGSTHASNMAIGPIKASHDGKKIATSCTFWGPLLNMFDFNSTTGQLSNFVNLLTKYSLPSEAYYGIEFSPNDSVLYIASTFSINSLYQLNLTTSSYTNLMSFTANYDFGGLQLAPDGKIYLARNNQGILGVINKPDIYGTGCNFVSNGFTLVGTQSQVSLPSFAPFIYGKTIDSYKISLGKDTSLCGGTPFVINLNNCNASYLWQDATTNSSHTISGPGTYWVKETSSCGVHTDTLVVTTGGAVPTPTITATGSTTICSGDSVTLKATGGTSYQWSGGVSDTSSLIQVKPKINTTYYLRNVNGGCTSQMDSIVIQVIKTPVATISGITALCVGQSTTLTAGGGANFQWSGGVSGSTSQISISPTIPTTYSVVVSNGSCSSQPISVTVNVLPLPQVSVSGNNSICAGQSTILYANGGKTYSWNTGSIDSVFVVSPVVPTTYTVTTSNGTCTSASKTIAVNVAPLPVVSYLGNTSICEGQSTTLTVTGGKTYSWSMGGTDSVLVVSPTSTTTYDVIGSNGPCNSLTKSITVNVSTLPVAVISGGTSICQGQSTKLTASGGLTYQWSGGVSSVSSSINIAPTVPTTYTVIVNDGICFSKPVSSTVVVLAQPVTAVVGDTLICSGENVTLNASGGSTYSWSGFSSSASSITVSPALTTTYSVVAENGTCPGSPDSITVWVVPAPVLNTSATPVTIAEGASTNLNVSGAKSYNWLPSMDLSCTNCSNPVANPLTSTVYTVIAIDSNGCSTSAFVKVDVKPACIGNETDLFIANVFSPNKDGQNDVLRVQGNGFRDLYWSIYDRWGNKLFETTDQAVGWDGMFRNVEMEQGTYVYYLKAICIRSGAEIELQGNVSLVK